MTENEYRFTFDTDGTLTAEERREMTLVNLARSKASKAKRKKQRRQKAAEKKLTEAEKREKEQQRIREERDQRRSMSEQNRREAGLTADPMPEPPELPEKPEKPEFTGETAEYPLPPEPEENPIDISIPQETKPETKPEPEKKQPRSEKRSKAGISRAAGGRYTENRVRAKKDANRITAGGAVMFGLLTTVLIGLVIYGRVQTNELYTEIAELQTEYDDLVAENVSMKSEMEGKMTVKNIQEYAENVLHLMPLNQSQIEYIQLQTEDEVTITEPEESFFVRVNDYLRRFWEFLSGK
ncbi:MAG: hypothetical protein IKQ39_05610 [Oscillospiraceae bacterium]|nr:hypothetical protein [Oscillospiraceae bacterium]